MYVIERELTTPGAIIGAGLAMRLVGALGTSPEFWPSAEREILVCTDRHRVRRFLEP